MASKAKVAVLRVSPDTILADIDRLVDRGNPQECEDRPEDFFTRDPHVGSHVLQDRGPNEVTAVV